MICEKCGSKDVKTIDTVQNKDAYEIYRKKVCKNCGRTFYTMEFEVEANDDFMSDWSEYHRDRTKTKKAKGEEGNFKRDVEIPEFFGPAKVGDKVRIFEYPTTFSFIDKKEIVTVGKVYGNGVIGVHYSEFKYFPEYRESIIKACEANGIPLDERDELIMPEDEHFRFLMVDYIIVGERDKN